MASILIIGTIRSLVHDAGGSNLLECVAMKAALLVESLTGNTWKAAEMIGDKLQQERWSITGMSKVGRPDLDSIQRADLVLIGTWTHGLFVVGQAPFALGNIANLPTMRGKKAACFLTFALNAGKSIDKLTDAVRQTGADVVGGLEIKRNYLDQHTDLFVERRNTTVIVLGVFGFFGIQRRVLRSGDDRQVRSVKPNHCEEWLARFGGAGHEWNRPIPSGRYSESE